MRVAIVTVLVLLSSFEAAIAQGIQDDPRRRWLVLPAVREATDCIAREALNEPGIESATRLGQCRPALAPPTPARRTSTPSCRDITPSFEHPELLPHRTVRG